VLFRSLWSRKTDSISTQASTESLQLRPPLNAIGSLQALSQAADSERRNQFPCASPCRVTLRLLVPTPHSDHLAKPLSDHAGRPALLTPFRIVPDSRKSGHLRKPMPAAPAHGGDPFPCVAPITVRQRAQTLIAGRFTHSLTLQRLLLPTA